MIAILEQLNALSNEQKEELKARLQMAKQSVKTHPATLPSMFMEWVKRYPDRVAISTNDIQVTYDKLAKISGKLAKMLNNLGVCRGHLVGLCVPRSIETIVAVFGIQVAGAGYIPLDPSLPKERLTFMVADSKVKIILAARSVLGVLPESNEKIIVIEDIWDELLASKEECVVPELSADDLAYVMYTSGSTGLPKGVAVTHRGFPGLVQYLYEAFGHATPRRVLHHTSMNFDISVAEYISALMCGSILVLAPPDMKAVGNELAQLLIEQGVEIILLTPTALATLPEKELSNLKYVGVGGESCPIDIARTWSSGRVFFNGYGPTETTIFVSIAQFSPDIDRIHIGKPVAKARLMVLDSRMQIVPVGVPGELYIGGSGLARGYVGRPELTAETFIADPFANDGSRMYRTGDRVRLLPSGDLEWLNRIDQQVKIRGFRIELGEIEQVLEQHQNVRQAVVIVDENGPSKRLVAFTTLNESVPVEEIRKFVGERLPSYMVPSIVIVMDTLPLGVTGKVDRKALTSMIPEDCQNEYVAPRTLVEEKLAIVLKEVLRLDREVSIYDDFFALGGDSIISLQVVFRARQEGIQLMVNQLFEHPMIADLALVVEIKEVEQVQAEQEVVTGKVQLTPIQQWFFKRKLNNPHYFNQSAVVEVPDELSVQDWENIIGCLLEQHDALRTSFTCEDGNWCAEMVGLPEKLPFKVIDLADVKEDICAGIIKKIGQEVQEDMRLDDPPLLKAVLFHGGENSRCRLLLVAHHLVIDVVSWRIILEDLYSLIEAVKLGKQLILPEKTSSWLQWANRITEEAFSERTRMEAEFWQTQMMKPEKSLPQDRYNIINTVARSRKYNAVLDEEVTQQLLHEMPAVFATQINDVLLTAVAAAIGSWSGVDSIRIDVEGHGRESLFDNIDVSRTVGWFTTISPVSIPVATSETLISALKQVKELMRIRPRHGIGYGMLHFTDTNSELSMAHISFNYLGQFDDVGEQFAIGMDMAGFDWDPVNERPYLIDIVGQVRSGKLHLTWDYSTDAFDESTIARVAEHTMSVIQMLVISTRIPKIHGYTPSDFPASGMSQTQIDQMISRICYLPIWSALNKPRPLLDCYPQTPIQQGLWFQSKLSGEEGAYHVQSVFTIEQELNTNVLRHAWSKVMRRHSVLRTSFWEDETGQAFQLVWDLKEPPLEELDWSEESDTKQLINDYLDHDRRLGFNSNDIPQWHILLVKTSQNKHQMILSVHHAIIDGWSIGLLLNELVNTYDAILHEEQQTLTPLTCSYRDYVTWLNTRDLEQTEAFWSKYLLGFDQATPLPKVGHSRNDHEQNSHTMVDITKFISNDLFRSMQLFAQENSLTLNTILQAAWAILLGHYAGVNDVVFGTVVSGRTSEVNDIEHMIGLFINTLPLRIPLPDQDYVIDWLHDIQDNNLQIRQHEYTPLNLIRGWTDIPSGAPLFHTLFVYENYPYEEAKTTLNLQQVDTREQTHYPLSLIVTIGEELRLDLMFDSRKVDSVTVDKIFNSIEIICQRLIDQPNEYLGFVTPLSENDRQQVTKKWSSESLSDESVPFYHDLVEQAAYQKPDTVAIVYNDEQLSYAELNRRTNQLGHWLQSQGVGPEVLVALYVERSIESLIGLFGILKAGGAYVPIDASTPTDRVAWIIKDANIKFAITQHHLKNKLPNDVQTLCLDTEWNCVSIQSEDIPETKITGDNLAYLIYTSGSTGIPKGVMVAHRCFSHVIPWIRSQPYLNRPRKVLQVASLSFDFSVWEIILPLVTGGTLYIPNRGERMIGNELGKKVRECAIESLNFTPGMLSTLEDTDLYDLDSLLIGGEAYCADLIRKWAPGRTYQNVYGPTETTIFATAAPLDENLQTIHMGRPITNVKVYVLDSSMRPVPIGCEGELYIGGAGLTRGYHHRPDLTAEYYVADPFTNDGGRLYRSGDVVRFLEDGNIEFVGRVDDQVKIRGFRIELGEIQSRLSEFPTVKNCVVIVHEDDIGKHLVAYIELHDSNNTTSDMLEQFLKDQLPPYMVPKMYVFMKALPLNRSGKVNRVALPIPDVINRTVTETSPRTATEACLVEIWEEVLGQHPISIDDDFFALGGHSLLAVSVATRVKNKLEIECPLRFIFDYPTVASLASQIDMLPKQDKTLDMAQLVHISRERSIPATADQQRLWFMEHLHPGSSLYTVGWLQYWEVSLNPSVLHTALDRLSLRHEPLRTIFKHNGEAVTQIILSNPSYELYEYDLSEVGESDLPSQVRKLSHDLWKMTFDLTKGPLLRITMMLLPEEKTVLAVSAHHAIIDGFSVPIFNRELKELYDDVLLNKQAPEPLKIQFADYAFWQSNELESESISEHLQYFTDQLSGAPNLISLPTDRLRPAVQDYRGANSHLMLEHELTELLDHCAMSLHTTRFVILLGIVASVLSRYSGQEQVVLGIPIANRSRVETEPMIGFLVNTIALCVDLSGDSSFNSVIAQVQQKLLEAHSHQHVPFERVVKHLRPERSLSHSPIFQVLVTGLDQFAEIPVTGQNGPAWLDEITDAGIGVAKFDLSITLQPSQNNLRLVFEYATSLFNEETVLDLGNHMLTFLSRVIRTPDIPINRIDLLNETERQLIIEARNLTDDNTTLSHKCLSVLFEEQVRRTPDRIAISFMEDQLTYMQMDALIEDIASTLNRLGAKPDVCIGICMRRSIDLVVGLYSIHRSGGAYVPLDPDLPAERLAYIVENAKINLILASPDTIDQLSKVHNCCILVMDKGRVIQIRGEKHAVQQSSTSEPYKALPDNLAYIIYTSGSTGKPKGVMLNHRGVVNRLLWMQQAYPLGEYDHVLQKTPFGFDVSVWEFFWPLLVGARLHIAKPDGHKDPEYLANLIQEQEIDTIHFVPSMLQQFIKYPAVIQKIGSLKHIVCSGEALPLEVQNDTLEMLPNVYLHNLYGPTEASIDVSFWECHVESEAISVPIGTPVANTQLYILDSSMSPVPDGVVGELYIGGIQLARGYLGQPDLTAERFVANPFHTGRLYATGDLARFRSSGVIEYIGRTDHQVKIRGLRIEIGEIETVLSEYPSVDMCVVVVHELSASDKRLTAFLTVKGEEESDIEEIRRFLLKRLPEYMVPAYFMILDELPLNSNGKINRKALPTIQDVMSKCQSQKTYIAPQNEMEMSLAKLWAELLGINQVGIQDDFFELGGHSLLVARMAAGVQEQWGIELKLSTVFQNRTIETLAVAIEEAETQNDLDEMDADELWDLV